MRLLLAFFGEQPVLTCHDGLLLTDLPPDVADAGWYGVRAWIEQGCTVTKRGGWQWQRTRITDPDRAARLWLASSVATRWLLSVGGAADATLPERTLLDVTHALAQGRRQRRAPRLRAVSGFRRGLPLIWTALRNRVTLPTGHFVPEPWPTVVVPHAYPATCPHFTALPQVAA